MSYYSSSDTVEIDRVEFMNKPKAFLYQEPHQMLLRNFISKNTPYDNVLLYNFVGTGKTCTSISIAEGFKEYINNMGRRIVVLVKNRNIQTNFINELLSKCTGDEYLTDKQREIYFSTDPSKQKIKSEMYNKLIRKINKSYNIITYGSFVNRVLGSKEFEKDNMGFNTTKVRKENGNILRKRAKNPINDFSNTVVIVDEVHNVTNNDVYIALHQVMSRSYNARLILLTATPMYDNPKEIFEIANLLNINEHHKQFPIRNELLRSDLVIREQSSYINGNVLKGGIVRVSTKGLKLLEERLAGKISFLKENTATNPDKTVTGLDLIYNRPGTTKVVYCQMSPYQYYVYMQAVQTDLQKNSNIDFSSAIQNLESFENALENVSISKTSSLYKNSSDASTMTYPDNLFGKEGFLHAFKKEHGSGFSIKDNFKGILTTDLQKYSNKLFNLLQNVKSSPGNVFVYTNYVSYGGTTLLRQVFLANGYNHFRSDKSNPEYSSFVIFDEGTNPDTREKYRRIFNSAENKDGKLIKIIIGSPIISEGITLKNVRQVHILEPSWNMSRINQIIGRAVRNHSHDDLLPEDRLVDVYKYVSVYYPEVIEEDSSVNMLKFFIDREKYILSEEKDRSNKEVERVLKEIAFDCSVLAERNKYENDNDFSPECDYTNCDFKCKHSNRQPKSDTYDLYIDYFSKFDIEYITSLLQTMFQKSFVWHLDDILTYVRNLEPNIDHKSVFYALGHLVDNKTTMLDQYNREGYVIQISSYYVFNPMNLDVSSSMYSRMLDFAVDKTKYTLNEYLKTKYTTESLSNTEQSKQKKVHLNIKESEKLSDADVEYNLEIMDKFKVYGTYRERGTKKVNYRRDGENPPFGRYDSKFRVIDTRDKNKKNKSKSNNIVQDGRKTVSGMHIVTFKKPDLVDIAEYLKIKINGGAKLDTLNIEQLAQRIQKHLTDKKMVLK